MANCRDCLHYEVCHEIEELVKQIGFKFELTYGGCNHFQDKSHYAEVSVAAGECYYKDTEDCPMREFMQDEGLDKLPTADLNYCSFGERGE